MSIPYVTPAISIFGTTLVVFESTGAYVDGRWSASDDPDRSIFGVIQPTKPEELQWLEEGDRSQSSITIHTESILQVHRLGSSTQTFVRYGGRLWRVAAEGNWLGQGFRRYVAVSFNERQ